MWKDAKFDELLEEAKTTQKRFSRNKNKTSLDRNKIKSFTLHMEAGRISAALRYLGRKQPDYSKPPLPF